MDLIDRYLAAVRRHLPRKLQDDVIQELSDNLRSEAEEREQDAGRALNADEQAALLMKHGHPWLMASRYLPQQHLIGPALYPYYRRTLAIVVFWVVLPLTLVGGTLAALYSDQPGEWFERMLGGAWNGSIYAVGIVTIVFSVLERERVRLTSLENWNPMRLPKLTQGREVSRSETLIGLVFELAFLVWWTGLVGLPNLIIQDGEPIQFGPAPLWSALYYPILLTVMASIGVYLVDLVRPWRTVAVSLADIAIYLATIVIVTIVMRENHFVTLIAGTPGDAARLAQLEVWVNRAIWWSFAGIGVICALIALNEVWHLVKYRRYGAIKFA